MRRVERFDRLRVAVQSLSPEHRQVVLLARVDRLPIREVARRMHRSVNATTQLLWRAMQKLKASFGDTESFHLPPQCLESRSDTAREPG
jgi:DNA-directed RNA polymerase specialized sigma24 family protein